MMGLRGKGGPLKGLGLLLIAWITVRVATFSAVPSLQGPGRETFETERVPAVIAAGEAGAASSAASGAVGPMLGTAGRGRRSSARSAALSKSAPGARRFEASSLVPRGKSSFSTGSAEARKSLSGGEPRRDIAGQRWAEATVSQAPARSQRWSGDGWMLLRRGSGGEVASGPRPASYGASQAGAILRYRLAPGSDRRPFAYLRGTTTLRGVSEQQAALGLGMRPFPAIPVSAAAEVRAVEGPAGLKIQPSAFLVTELAPVVLPVELQAEIYAQAGYVGGAFATPFADGQLRVDRALAEIGRITARIGAGAWGGAQKGAARLDVGPAATIWLPVSRSGGARLALDWRLRVAGDAKPESGPALTLSAGF
jgi:hypothetical protein